MPARALVALGALLGLAAVALSAWAAHAAPSRLAPPELAALASALQIAGWHAPALVAAGLLAERREGALALAAGWLMALGALLFAGAVTWRALAGVSLGPVAPTGGFALMAGWLLLAVAALRR